MATPDLIVVVPVYNEQLSIVGVVEEWLAELRASGIKFQMLFFDDGSTDETLNVLRSQEERNEELEVIAKQNSGHGKTCILGYETAIARGGQWIFQIDSDGQCDPKYFMQFWQARKPGICIQGFRRTREDGLNRLLGSRLLSLYLYCLSGLYVRDSNVPYRLMDRDSLSAASSLVSSAEIDLANVALSFIYQRDFAIEWIPINFRQRANPRPPMGVAKTLGMAMTFFRQFKRSF